MSEKRKLQTDEIKYNATIIVERMSSYAIAEPFCKGRRVLDIACADGFGAAYIVDSGAESVLGVDLSKEAIEYARTTFFGESISFIAANATDVKAWNPDNNKFDVIICSHIFEYTSEMEALLNTLRDTLAPNGTMLIGYPNTSISKGETTANPVFDRSYSLKEFQKIATEVLGEADQWLVGTPIAGMTVFDARSIMLNGNDLHPIYKYGLSKIDDAIILSTQHLGYNDPAYYLGIWNGNSDPLLIGDLFLLVNIHGHGI
ncbi:bifunctional 2-polyprenyl-6-hydroxyphenol methylase/3-demethylubiquinol 3-O-methyltransferase UbiG [Brucella sp. 09RB8910]|uniref:class I SAM-dependent methyltransferase n=1 Tax=Brucella sp. 09RB8910 TaxID=1844051 RepID=UPI0009728CD7|nr:class I SAM-dependent methyltransferase [Brucella sp. 09RB8910]APY13348.1 hypothetical protein BKD02_02635 [Brucella sp. 09RB8910]